MSASDTYRSPSKTFSEDDYLRVSRLREEIISRATKLSLIMARTLDVAPPQDIREFTLTDGPRGEPLDVSVLRSTDPGSSQGGTVEIITWGCTCHTNRVCCADPDCPPCP